MIKTSHVGSLPRGEQLVPLLLARDKGEPYDAEEFDRVVQEAVTEAVRQQGAAEMRAEQALARPALRVVTGRRISEPILIPDLQLVL